MPLGSLLCALWTACVAGRRRCSGGFCPASTSPPPTHFWLPPCHTKARGAGLPQFVVMCRLWLQAIHSCLYKSRARPWVIVVCRLGRPSICQTSAARTCSACLWQLFFVACLLAPSSHCMVTFDVNLFLHAAFVGARFPWACS